MRFSILTLLGLVAFAALGTAALLKANPLWASLIFTGAAVSIATALAASFILNGRRRSFAIGFAVFGATYFLFTLLPISQVTGSLISESALPHLHTAVVKEVPGTMTQETHLADGTVLKNTSNVVRLFPDKYSFLRVGRMLSVVLCGLLGAFIGAYLFTLRQKQNAQGAEHPRP